MSARLEQLLKFLEQSPGDAFLRFALAKEYEKLGDDDRTARYYALLLDENPDYIGTYYHYGKWLEHRDQPLQALAVYDRGIALARSQGDRHALSELSEARLNLDDEEA